MSLNTISEVWENLRQHINPMDRNDAADALVSTLLDNDYDVDDIKEAFRNDSEIRSVLASYDDENDHLDDDDEEEEEEW